MTNRRPSPTVETGRSGGYAGAIVAWWRTGLAAAVAIGLLVSVPHESRAQAEADRGALALVQCYACHAIEQPEDSIADALGPRIGRMLGQPIAGDPDFEYSEAMRAFAEEHGVWTEELLDEFLFWPDRTVPGTTMDIPGMADDAERASLIEHLRTLED